VGKGSGSPLRRALWIGIGVLALAGVIFAGGALTSSRSRESAPPSKLSAAVEAERHARDALAALSREETAAALALADRALELDSNNVTANRVVSRAKQVAEKRVPSQEIDARSDNPGDTPSDPAPSGAPPSSDPPPTQNLDEGYTDKVSDLAGLLPSSVSGWVSGQVVAQSPDALVTLDPAKGSPGSSMALRAVVSVHDMETPAKADDFVAKVSKRTYSKDGTTVTAGVVPDAYFGTNGTGVAAVAFSRGRFAFDVVVPAKPGVRPVDLKAIATSVAGAMPAAR